MQVGTTDGQSIVKVFTKYDSPILRILVPTVPDIFPVGLDEPVEVLEPPLGFITYKKQKVTKGLCGVKFVTYKKETK